MMRLALLEILNYAGTEHEYTTTQIKTQESYSAYVQWLAQLPTHKLVNVTVTCMHSAGCKDFATVKVERCIGTEIVIMCQHHADTHAAMIRKIQADLRRRSSDSATRAIRGHVYLNAKR